MPTVADEQIVRLTARRTEEATKRAELDTKRKAILEIVKDEARAEMLPEEDTEFRKLTADIKAVDAELIKYDERIAELSDEAERSAKLTQGELNVRTATARAAVTREGQTYNPEARHSYFRDLIMHQLGQDGNGEARERLQRHAVDVRTAQEYRDLNRTDGTGGYFVPPAWLMSRFIDLARAGRAFANLAPTEPLPPGTDSINIPKVATGTATDIQDGDNTAVEETDLTDTSINAPVRTIAGQQDVALQLLEQSPVNFDQVVFRDLMADYATRTDLQVIAGTGANGQVLGVRNTSGIITVTASTATVKAVYSAMADAVQRVHTQRFMPPTVIVMHPRRWAWFLAATDTTDRPLVVPSGPGQNAIATLGVVGSEQVVGEMHGLPVVTDPNLPTTLGAATNEDTIYVMRASDLLLWETGIRSRVLPEVGSGTLTVRLQVYGYLAFSASRYPKGIVEIGGAGLVAPTF